MEYRNLGHSGLRISALSFGSWVTFGPQVDVGVAKEMMTYAYDHGVNFFDNAEVYSQGESERIMGEAIEGLGWSRDTFCVSSKVYWGGERPTQRGLSRKHVTDACHAALKRLRVDYLDLYFCHRPDVFTPVAETVRAMHALIQQGKVLYWGTSEWSAQQITEAHLVAERESLTPPTMEQPQYNLLHRERFESEYARLYLSFGMGTTIWSPLASGILSGKYNDGIPSDSRMNLKGYEWLRQKLDSPEGQANLERARKLTHLAKELGVSVSKLSIAWCLKNPNVSTVILGASKMEQLRENLAAADVVAALTPEVLERVEAIVENKPPGPPVF